MVVDVPVGTACPQWTQFEGFPTFMEAVEEVTQFGEKHLRWRATIGAWEETREPRLTEQARTA